MPSLSPRATVTTRPEAQPQVASAIRTPADVAVELAKHVDQVAARIGPQHELRIPKLEAALAAARNPKPKPTATEASVNIRPDQHADLARLPTAA